MQGKESEGPYESFELRNVQNGVVTRDSATRSNPPAQGIVETAGHADTKTQSTTVSRKWMVLPHWRTVLLTEVVFRP